MNNMLRLSRAQLLFGGFIFLFLISIGITLLRFETLVNAQSQTEDNKSSLTVETLLNTARKEMLNYGLQGEPQEEVWHLLRADEWGETMASLAYDDPSAPIFIYAVEGILDASSSVSFYMPGTESTSVANLGAYTLVLDARTGYVFMSLPRYVADPGGETSDEQRRYYAYMRNGGLEVQQQTMQAEIDLDAELQRSYLQMTEIFSRAVKTTPAPESTVDLQPLP
jgi:hypothetical protein